MTDEKMETRDFKCQNRITYTMLNEERTQYSEILWDFSNATMTRERSRTDGSCCNKSDRHSAGCPPCVQSICRHSKLQYRTTLHPSHRHSSPGEESSERHQVHRLESAMMASGVVVKRIDPRGNWRVVKMPESFSRLVGRCSSPCSPRKASTAFAIWIGKGKAKSTLYKVKKIKRL